jgi:hypothetical protein
VKSPMNVAMLRIALGIRVPIVAVVAAQGRAS